MVYDALAVAAARSFCVRTCTGYHSNAKTNQRQAGRERLRGTVMPPLPPRQTTKVTEGDIRREIEIALNRQGLVRVFLNAQYSGPARG